MAGGGALRTWLRSGVVSEDELDCCEHDELPPLPGELVEAVDELFEELDDLRRLEDAAVRELLWRVLERVGRLDGFCLEEASVFGRTVEDARDSEAREWLSEQERNFVGYCPGELDAIARAAIEFTVALWIGCSPDWEEPSQSVSGPGPSLSQSCRSLRRRQAGGSRWTRPSATSQTQSRSRCGVWLPRSRAQPMSWPTRGCLARPGRR